MGNPGTYVHVHDIHDRCGAGGEAETDAGGEDLGQRVEAENAPDLGQHARLERKVRRRARRGPEVEVVVRVVLEDEEVVCTREREHFAPPCLRRSHAGWVSTVLCKRYGIRERWRQGAKDRDVWTYGYGVEDLGLGLVRGPVLELGAEGISIDALGVRRYGYRKDRFPISTSQAASVRTYKLAMQ